MRSPASIELLRGGFGKLPAGAEFVRARAEDRSVQEFEGWLQQGLFHSRRELGARFDERYDAGLNHCFIFRPDNFGQTVVGIVRSSWDSVGRRFPFVVFGLLPSKDWDCKTLLLPLLHDELFGELRGTLARAPDHAGAGAGKLVDWLMLPLHPITPAASAMARYHNFLQDMECADLALPDGAPGESIVRDLIGLLGGLPQDPRRLSFSIVLPLAQPAQCHGLLLRFWIELCLLLTSRFPPTLSLFWSSSGMENTAADDESARPELHLCFRPPAGGLFGALLDSSMPSRLSWRPGGGAPPPGMPPMAPARTMVSAETSLWEVLLAVRPGLAEEWPGWLRGRG